MSNSVSNGLLFYKSDNTPDLEDYDTTAMFCSNFNDCFDALNRKFGAEGLRVNDKNRQEIKLNKKIKFNK